MKKPPQPTIDANLIAVLHRCGRAWHALLVNRSAGTPTITASREFASDQADRIDRWLVEQQVGSVFCVLPAGAVICRTVPLPDAPADQLAPALSLQAEAHLLGIAPPHRVGMAVLPAALGETTRSGLVLAWPVAAEFTAPVTSRLVRYVPDIAALAALLNGLRPTEPAMWLDRGDGSVAIAITHSGGAMFRATREEAESGDAWQKSVGRIVAESALGVGHTGPYIEKMVQDARARASAVGAKDAALILPKEVHDSAMSRVQGITDEARWWNEYGISVGVAIAATGALAPLTAMMHTPPVRKASRIRNALEAMSSPRTAATVVAVCILLLMFAPLAFSGMRLLALNVRYGDVAQQLNIAKASRDQVEVYRELKRQNAWPMTKLLSDIATNAPLGIELEVIRLDAGKDFSVGGTAIANGGMNPAEVVAQMLANLRADGIFVDPSLSWGDANNLGILKFDITGKVANPFYAANYPPDRDFKAWTHKDRRDGVPMPKSGAPRVNSPSDENTVAVAGDTTPNGNGDMGEIGDDPANGSMTSADPGDDHGDENTMADAGGDDISNPDPRSGGSSVRTPSNRGSTAGADPTTSSDVSMSAGQIPPKLTEAEIAAMSEPEVKKALTAVAKARPHARDNPELDERLKQEFTLLMEQLKKVKGGAS